MCIRDRPKWAGKCPGCGQWNTIQEEIRKPAGADRRSPVTSRAEVRTLQEIHPEGEVRDHTGLRELDRVLGGGIVRGALMLIGGDPGIGKSTLLLQICGRLDPSRKILYVSGEESERQIKLRADRLGVHNPQLYVLCETDVDTVLEAMRTEKPDLVDVYKRQLLSSWYRSTQRSTSLRMCSTGSSGRVIAVSYTHLDSDKGS